IRRGCRSCSHSTPSTTSRAALFTTRDASSSGRAAARRPAPAIAAAILRVRRLTAAPRASVIQAVTAAQVIPAAVVATAEAVTAGVVAGAAVAAAVAETSSALRQPRAPDFLHPHVVVDCPHGLLHAPGVIAPLDGKQVE